MKNNEAKIHIAVACHKPSRLPENPLLVPVQVNSANAGKRMDMAHDDEGENISLKNPEYCELTAQYWEWKNVEADYYGLCHYRRFLCFTEPKNAVYNERSQIQAEAIDDFNLARFGLEDAVTMRRIIEQNDVVTGFQQDISKVYTPRGKQPTAYKHWTAHNRALIMTEDLDRMLDILERVAPEVGKDTREYLNGGAFSGYNCFVMKRELFRELCRIEFDVLEKLEQSVDITRYCTQLSRIYGYMGEIISSGYMYHLEKEHYKVKRVPLVYFNDTEDDRNKYRPEKEEIPILFYQTLDQPELFAVTWKSFLLTVNPAQKYRAIICHTDMSSACQKAFAAMAEDMPNIRVQFLNGNSLRRTFAERYGERYSAFAEKTNDDLDIVVPVLPFLPYYLDWCGEILVIRERMLVESDPAELWKEHLEEGKIIAAAKNMHMLARINYIYPERDFNYMQQQMHDPFEYYAVSVVKINLDAYRKKVPAERMIDFCLNTQGGLRQEEEILNVAFEGHFQQADQKWDVWLESNPYLAEVLPYAPRENYQNLIKARKNPGVIEYMRNDPFEGRFTELSEPYWSIAAQTPQYPICQGQALKTQLKMAHKPRNITKKLVKEGTGLRATVKRVLPQGSRRYRYIKKTLSMLHLE